MCAVNLFLRCFCGIEKWREFQLSREEDISNVGHDSGKPPKEGTTKKKKWTRRQGVRKGNQGPTKKVELESGKRNLIDVMINEKLEL